MLTNDDLVLQRLPELNLSALKSFWPFGFNPYGMKVTTKVGFQATKIARDTGYDGLRTDFRPQAAIPFHDLHHVATGYGTDFVGEAEVGMWELRAGCETAVVYFLNGMAVLIGLSLSPRRMLAAYRAAKGAQSLYRAPVPVEKLLAMRVGELRAHLGVPDKGIGVERRLHEDARLLRERQIGTSLADRPATHPVRV